MNKKIKPKNMLKRKIKEVGQLSEEEASTRAHAKGVLELRRIANLLVIRKNLSRERKSIPTLRA